MHVWIQARANTNKPDTAHVISDTLALRQVRACGVPRAYIPHTFFTLRTY